MDSITNLLSITLGAILVNNFIFSQFLGCCPPGVSSGYRRGHGHRRDLRHGPGLRRVLCGG